MKRFSGKTILVVDDEPVLRGAIGEEFEYEGAKVFEASNGTEAFEIVKQNKVDAVVSDVRMPGGNGIELLDRIKALSLHAPVVLLITAYSDVTTDEAYAKGVEAILSKPFDLDELLSRVHHFLQPALNRFDRQLSESPLQMIQRSLPDLKAAIQQNGIQIGRGGIFIQGVCENEKLGETQFKITFSSGELHFIEGQGIVRWLRKKGTENLPTGLGIEFTYLPENIRNQVLEYIRLNNPVPFIPNGPKSKS